MLSEIEDNSNELKLEFDPQTIATDQGDAINFKEKISEIQGASTLISTIVEKKGNMIQIQLFYITQEGKEIAEEIFDSFQKIISVQNMDFTMKFDLENPLMHYLIERQKVEYYDLAEKFKC